MSVPSKYLILYAFRSKPTTNAEDIEEALEAWRSVCSKYGCLEMQLLRCDAEQELMEAVCPDHAYIQIWESEESYREWRKRFDDFNSELRRSYFTEEEFGVIRSIRKLTEYSDGMEFVML